jgi:endonuclease/exonuclease/phosphatase family metal-dependent hydrolase
MQLRTPWRGRRLVATVAALGLVGLPLLTSTADAATGPDSGPGTVFQAHAPAVKVMTRNLYLGADIMRPIQAIGSVPKDDPSCPENSQCYQLKVLDAFSHANDQTEDIADATSFPDRAKLLASELVANKPDLVGLQEVALWRTGEFESPLSPSFLVANAPTVRYDFLKILLDELKAQGVAYKAVSVNTLSDVEGPAYEGHFGGPDFTNQRDVRLTMRDVILMRKGSSVHYVADSAKQRTYETNMPPIVVAGHSIEFIRGFQWVQATAGGQKFRFINTHLEAFSSDVAFAQAQEMVEKAGSFKGTTILTCDCNSDPANGTIKPGETKRHWAPYFLIKRAGGFNDTWEQWDDPSAGFSSGLSETVDDDTAAGFDHRIDMVFARTGDGSKLHVLSGTVTGNEVGDRNEAGLWPSDHAGVVMKLRLP